MHKHHHLQEELALTWAILHNLDSSPHIEVYGVSDSGESSPKRIHPQRIEYVSDTEIRLSFSSLKKGFAFLS